MIGRDVVDSGRSLRLATRFRNGDKAVPVALDGTPGAKRKLGVGASLRVVRRASAMMVVMA